MQKQIMILEDEPLLAMLVESMVEEMGMTSISPGSRSKAFESIEEAPPDLVLLDVNLWGQQSTDLAGALNAKGIPFVLMTGYDLEEMQRLYGAVPMLSKPFDSELLAKHLLDRPVA